MDGKRKILIMGLPGSGKTTLSMRIKKTSNTFFLNGDYIRERYNDYDFSLNGRLKQAERMKYLADGIVMSDKKVIADFVCPTEETRKIFDADFIIWMDTVEKSRFKDTNLLFENPDRYDIRIKKFNSEEYTSLLISLNCKSNIL